MSHRIIFDQGPVGGLIEEYPRDGKDLPLPLFKEVLYLKFVPDELWVARYRYGATASPAAGEYRSTYLYDDYAWPVPHARS